MLQVGDVLNRYGTGRVDDTTAASDFDHIGKGARDLVVLTRSVEPHHSGDTRRMFNSKDPVFHSARNLPPAFVLPPQLKTEHAIANGSGVGAGVSNLSLDEHDSHAAGSFS